MAFFCLFSFFSQDKYSANLTINDKSLGGVLGTQTWGGRMVGVYDSTELNFAGLLEKKKEKGITNFL